MDTTKVVQDILPVYEDVRGKIVTINQNTLFITSNPGAIRANHWHRNSGHLCFVNKGEIWYAERPVGSKEKPTTYIIQEGESFWTGPNIEHVMKFGTYTEFICLSTGCRSQEEYEKDLVRLDFNLGEA